MKRENEAESRHRPSVENLRLLTYDTPFAVREAYVRLRTNLMFCVSRQGDPCTTFVVTSGNPAEGKSITAANVSISFAMLGKKTLLIDADMRKPAQQNVWHTRQSSTGLCNYLAGIGELGLGHVDGIPLSIAFCGVIPPNPSELLSSTRMRSFLKSAHELYDYVIVDTAPVNTVADAQILSPMVDGVMLVTRSRRSTTEELGMAVEAVEHSGGNLCGVVVNDMDMKTSGYSYRYKYDRYAQSQKYGYGHKYGYGYSYGGSNRVAYGQGYDSFGQSGQGEG
jgi:capsular exopolysaccharide synthesis family protein